MKIMEKYQVRKILHNLDLERKRILKPLFLELGLTVGEGQPRILNTLIEQGTMTQRELAENCMLDVTTMSRTLDKLEHGGLLERKVNPKCRRSYLISLTEAGEKKAVQVRSIFAQLDEKMWNGIDKEEMEQMYLTLEKIHRNLQKD